MLRIDITHSGHTGNVRHMEGARKQALETGRVRLMVTGVLFVLAFLMIGARLVDLTLLDGVKATALTRTSPSATEGPRADLLDRNGIILATSLPIADLFADPAEFAAAREDAEQSALRLSEILPGLDRKRIAKRLESQNRFTWIRRGLPPNEQQKVNDLGIAGLHFKTATRRVYPHGPTAAHMLGLTDIDGRGIAGAEQSFETRLANGEPVRLSLDIRLQSMLREQMMEAVAKFQAQSAAGIVLDAVGGGILAMVSLPDFDPNDPSSMTDERGFNRAAKGVYEMGSTFKLFNTAIALDTGTVKIGDSYDAREPIRYSGHVISDFHPESRHLSIAEILIHSSNIASAKMAADIGGQAQKAYLNNLGLLKPAAVNLPEVGSPLWPRPWREINTMTISYGYGIAVSPLQMAAGVAAVVNGGILPPLTLDLDGTNRDAVVRRVFSPKTSKIMRHLMRRVVEEGTGRKAAAPGYRVGGKTGTAEKMVAGRYRKGRLVSSFVAAFPIDAPRYVLLVMLDEPKGNKDTHFYATAGWTAAPVVGRMVKRMAPLLGIEPNFDSEDGQAPGAARAVLASFDDSAPLERETGREAN